MWSTQGGYDGYNPNQTQGGGGYMSPGTGTPQQGQAKTQGSRAQNIMPVTVAEVLDASQDHDRFLSGNIEISQVTFVGLVHSVKESPTRLDYEIEDCTGPLVEVKQFVDNDESVPENEKVKALPEKTYVRIYGHVRSFGGKRSIVAFKVLPLVDMNELTAHILEVVFGHLMVKRVKPQTSDISNGNKTLSNDYDTSSVSIPGLGHLHNQVHQIIKSNRTEEGCNIDSVIKQLRGVAEKSIRDVIDFLSAEGHIYSTIDDEHFKATDG